MGNLQKSLYLCKRKEDMIADTAYIQLRFEEYNRLYFGGELPTIPIRLSNAKGFLGKVCYKRVRKKNNLLGRIGGRIEYENTDFVLRINTRIDLPEEVVEDTILHEMIHYYIAYHQWQDTSTHGALFRREMDRINRTGNRHIGISLRLTTEQQTQAIGTPKMRIAGIVYFKDGKLGIKIVPKQIRAILQFQRQAEQHFDINHIDWYITKDEYFSKYPSSAALRIYLIDDYTKLNSALRNARRILYDGQNIRMEPNRDSNLSW